MNRRLPTSLQFKTHLIGVDSLGDERPTSPGRRGHRRLQARLDQEQDRRGLSLADQRATLALLAEREGWLPVQVYEEPGRSGETLTGRPQLQRLLRDVNAGRVKRVLVFDLTRLSRSDRPRVEIVERLETAGVPIVTERGHVIDYRDPQSEMYGDISLRSPSTRTRCAR